MGGILAVAIGLVLYFIIRASDDETDRVLTYLFIGFSTVMVTLMDQWTEPMANLGIAYPKWISLQVVAFLLFQGAAVYHDYVHTNKEKEKTSPKKRGGKRKKN